MNPLPAVTAFFNVVGGAIKAQSAKLSEIISVDQQATAYHAGVESSLLQLQSQQMMLVAVLVIAVLIFLFMIMRMN